MLNIVVSWRCGISKRLSPVVPARPYPWVGREFATITDMAFSPDGSRLATGSQDTTARIWTLGPEGAQESLILAGHTDEVLGLAFSPDGGSLATSSDDGTVRIWDISPSGSQEILTQAGHFTWLRRMAYSPDGARLATTNGDGQAVVLDAETGETVLTFPHPTGVIWEAVFSPDGTRLVTAGEDNTARVWDANNGQELLTLTGHAEAPPVGNFFGGSPPSLSAPMAIVGQCRGRRAGHSLGRRDRRKCIGPAGPSQRRWGHQGGLQPRRNPPGSRKRCPR